MIALLIIAALMMIAPMMIAPRRALPRPAATVPRFPEGRDLVPQGRDLASQPRFVCALPSGLRPAPLRILLPLHSHRCVAPFLLLSRPFFSRFLSLPCGDG